MDSTPEDLPFQLKEQARDRFEEYRADHAQGADTTDHAQGADEAGHAPGVDKQNPAEDEDRLTPGPGQEFHEYRRLRHSAELAAKADRLTETEGEPDS